MKSRKTLAGAVALAAIIAVGWLVVPSTEGTGDHASARGFPGRVLRKLRSIIEHQQTILANQQRILADQQTILANQDLQAGIQQRILANQDLQATAGDVRGACAPPDLVPVPLDVPPFGFCRVNSNGNLQVRVKNQGAAQAGNSTLLVSFHVNGGADPRFAPTQGLGPNGAVDVEIPSGLPEGCFVLDPTGGASCTFQIAVDVNDDVTPEVDHNNNHAVGTCLRIE
jgi:hypothetical protein